MQSDSPPTRRSGRVVEWDRQKGFGFLQSGGARIFLHRRDFTGPHRPPSVGDVITFTPGADSRGRPCATCAELARGRWPVLVRALLVVLPLTVLPALALMRVPYGGRWVAGGILAVNAITFWEFVRDRRCARNKNWRTPEKTLHTLELLGGWPAAFLAQRWLRHKCSKGSYQMTFWMIVLLYQAAACDSLVNWEASRWMYSNLNRLVDRVLGHPEKTHSGWR